jgi:protein phosphatase/bis(5'-nucleosyl)-tetraphosphatase (symmetrical)
MKYACIGDVHGRHEELVKLLDKLGIRRTTSTESGWISEDGYKVIQLGDLCDYGIVSHGYSSVKCFEIMMELTAAGLAEVLYSNHHDKLLRYLKGNKVKPSHGLENTIEEIKECSMDFQGELFVWISKLPLHIRFSEYEKEYICAHAYFDLKLEKILAENNQIDTEQLIGDRKGMEYLRATAIYGPRTEMNGTERLKWWEDETWIAEKFNPNIHYIVAHLHIFKAHKQFHILDSEQALMCWIPSEDRYIGIAKRHLDVHD